MSSHPSTAYQAGLPGPPPIALQEFAEDLSTSVSRATSQREYTDVYVLAFHWENDEVEAQLESQLLDVFKRIYNFHVESYVIPLVTSQDQLLNRLSNWIVKHQGGDILRIIIYSGHTSGRGTTTLRWNLFGRVDVDSLGRRQGPSLNWWEVRAYLKGVDGDTCLILDCCCCDSLALGDPDSDELVAASGWGALDPNALSWSFTQALTDTLKDLDGTPATLAQIYATIFHRAQQNQLGEYPIHIPHREKPSVTIAPLGAQRVLSRSTRERPEAAVMLRARIRADMPHDPNMWKAWLAQDIPPDVVEAGITFESMARGRRSCILIINVPVEVWTMLPRNNRTYTFVAHISSGLTSISRQPFALPIRPALPPARENSPPRYLHHQS